jgi:hypothetical protein
MRGRTREITRRACYLVAAMRVSSNRGLKAADVWLPQGTAGPLDCAGDHRWVGGGIRIGPVG